ncbi:MAG: DNA polymerase IV [Oscillospiraceae bacterium]
MEKIILHCDLNNFFASVECHNNPKLKNYPVAVCGSVEDRHGIVLAKNDKAKAFGVKTAEAIWQAKSKCPDLVIVPPHMEQYIEFSKKAREVYSNYTDLIEPFGIDECWLDVTGSQLLFGTGEEIAFKIKEQIKSDLGITASIGVSFNKVFSKLGSDMKKPDAITVIKKEDFKEKIWHLNANEIIGIGKSTYEKLKKFGINTIGDLASTDRTFLTQNFGKNGEALWYSANGIGGTIVAKQDEINIVKSIGNSTTCSMDLTKKDDVWQVFLKLAENVTKRLRDQNLLASGIQISIKNNALFTREFQSPLPFNTRYPKDLATIAIQLFSSNYDWSKPVRALGIRAINLISADAAIQYSLIYNQEKINEHDNLEQKVFDLRKRYGENAVQRASLMDINGKFEKIKSDYSTLPNNSIKK